MIVENKLKGNASTFLIDTIGELQLECIETGDPSSDPISDPNKSSVSSSFSGISTASTSHKIQLRLADGTSCVTEFFHGGIPSLALKHVPPNAVTSLTCSGRFRIRTQREPKPHIYVLLLINDNFKVQSIIYIAARKV